MLHGSFALLQDDRLRVHFFLSERRETEIRNAVKRLQHPDTFRAGQSISDSGSDGTGRPELRYVRRKSIRTNSFPPCST